MKKSKRLTLTRETLRNLRTDTLIQAGAGGSGQITPSYDCPTYTCQTCSCDTTCIMCDPYTN
jgi:hypothetical protein